jgi:Nucleotidyl transferase AbiEii toxin, Type IV TA system
MEWYKLSTARQQAILEGLASQTGLPAQAIEKDWWVTQCLRAIFRLSLAEHLIFKGGTSLSKGWGLIDRFSEDIDLSVSRDYLGFGGEISNSQVKKLRKASCAFVTDCLAEVLQASLIEIGIPQDAFQLTVPIPADSDIDPQVIYVGFPSVLAPLAYLPTRVKIEVGCRALMEPTEARPLQSMIGAGFPNSKFGDPVFMATTVLPKRTFLEKIFLLHETLQLNPERIGSRLTRHLYDIERLMDTEHGLGAVQDLDLFDALATFRARFNTIKHVDYSKHNFAEITFVPQVSHRKGWENDYLQLQESMLYGDHLSFHALMARLEELQGRFRKSNEKPDMSEPRQN